MKFQIKPWIRWVPWLGFLVLIGSLLTGEESADFTMSPATELLIDLSFCCKERCQMRIRNKKLFVRFVQLTWGPFPHSSSCKLIFLPRLDGADNSAVRPTNFEMTSSASSSSSSDMSSSRDRTGSDRSSLGGEASSRGSGDEYWCVSGVLGSSMCCPAIV